MTMEYDLNITKPISIWNRDLSISPKGFFTSLTKAAISGVVADGKAVAENLLDAATGIAHKDKPAYAAWLLVYKSLQKTLSELVEEYGDFFSSEVDAQNLEDLATELESALNEVTVGFDASIFDAPHKLPLLEDIKGPLSQWLMALGMTDVQANALHLRLKERFVLSLHHQWLAAPSEYACIEEALSSPFVKATKDQRGWLQYNAWLQEQANELRVPRIVRRRRDYPCSAYR